MNTSGQFARKLSLALTSASALAMACTHAAPPTIEPCSAPKSCPSATLRTAFELQKVTGCVVIKGDLRIEGTALRSLEGLGRLESVTGTFRMAHNRVLENLDDLSRLRAADTLEVTNNPSLADLSGLESLSRARRLLLSDNPNLRNLEGLEGLNELDALIVRNNGIFTTVGLSGLEKVSLLVVADNPRLISLRGLSSVRQAETIHILRNPRVAAVEGLLSGITTPPEQVELRDNLGLSRSDVKKALERWQRTQADPERAVASDPGAEETPGKG